MRKKAKKCVKKRKMRKKGENHSDPIYTNPIKNLPIWAHWTLWTFRYFLFFLLGGGEGGVQGDREGGGVGFLLKIPGGVGGSPWTGGEGAEMVSAGNFFGGGG